MKLKYVEVKNFRSIEYAKIDFTQSNGLILVGINESGKSNILKALALLSPNRSILQSDKRTERQEEDEIKESYVRFIFEISDQETDEIYSELEKKFVGGDLDSPLFSDGTRTYTFREFCKSRLGLYTVNLIDNIRSESYFRLAEGMKIIADWKKLKSFSEPILLEKKGQQPFTVAVGTEFINAKFYDAIDPLFEDIKASEINTLVGKEITKVVSRELPECILWEYDEKNVLPTQVGLDEFQNDPNVCIPLKNCFEHAGIVDPSSAIQTARQQSRHKLLNLLEKVSSRTTDYIQSVWSDYKHVTIEFQPDGNLILPIVKDKNINFDFYQRSDGFKRFITFLMLVSSKVKTNKINNTLVLIDEPEIGLHPTGARNLMQELMRIANTNYVVYSTHSIFMVDKEHINRHLIVEKKDEITSIKTVDKSRIIDEEVIYKAIGFSLLEILKPINLVFEGWRDKQLFEVARKSYLKEHKDNANMLELNSKISTCHAEGVKDIKNISPLIELANREMFIISDSDAAAKENQKKHQEAKMHGIWKTYQDITGNPLHITGEDFLTNEAIAKKIKPLTKKYPKLNEFDQTTLNLGRGKLVALEHWLLEATQPDEKQSVLNELKSYLFESLKDSDIDHAYKEVITYIFKQAGNTGGSKHR